MNDTRNSKKEKNQHIQVFVRVRPINSTEKAIKSQLVVDVPSNKEVIVRERPQDKLTKKFTFDKVFGPVSKQVEVYNAVVSPLLDEVLAGYNCTVFAYGQTGTGKTFTMEGMCNDPSLHWQSDSSAGIIPRTLSHLFDELRTLDAQEYSVRVSFLELYNEELFDLLSPSDDASKIRIYEDAARKGAIIIHGLEEVTVHNKNEVYKILEKGSEKRQTAATLMNAQSSRSHTVFSITVHIKENTVDGEELLKTGKLNLVDLAGSENVGRSGAVDRRAREAGNINQSLLTLGRVITALVERAPHIPYRESKLTRLLQESLGGRTKTSIIATISPASINIEETLSTLDYAHRAKNITNRPEINQKLSKKALLKEYTEEIEKLRRDLLATRERNGVYLAPENYNGMQALIDIQGKENEEKRNHIKALEETLQNKEKIFTDLKLEFESTTNVLHETKDKLESTKNVLMTTKNQLDETVFERDLQKHLVDKHVSTEHALSNQAKTLLNVAEVATTDTHKLHEKISRKQKVEEENESISEQFRQEMSNSFQRVKEDLDSCTQEGVTFFTSLIDQTNFFVLQQNTATDTTINHISKDLVQLVIAISEKLAENTNKNYDEYQSWVLANIEKASEMTEHQRQALQNICTKISPKIRELVENKISENLRALHNETSLKLINFSNTMKRSMEDFCNKLVSDRDNSIKQIEKIEQTIDIAVNNQKEIINDDQSFSKILDNLASQFEYTVKQYKDFTTKNKNRHSILSSKLSEARIENENMKENIVTCCKNNIKQEEFFKEQVEKYTEDLRQDVSSTLEQNWSIADNVITESVNIINQFEGDVNNSRYALLSYKNLFEANAMELLHKTEKEKEAIFSKVQEYQKVVSDASTAHTHFMEEQRTMAQNTFSEMNFKLESQAAGSSEWNNKISAQLHSTHEKVEKFVVEELRRDRPTGTTPARREFSYPRHLVATSPHERIIQRFREARKVVENSEDEDNNTIIEMMSPSLNGIQSTSLTSPVPSKNNHVTSSTPYSDSKLRLPIQLSNNYSLIKSASTSDIPLATKIQLDSTPMSVSESDVIKEQGNKENGEEFIKPDRLKPKRLSNKKRGNRKVLGFCN